MLKSPASGFLPQILIYLIRSFSSSHQGSWQFNLLCLQIVKVEFVTFESSFMSERTSLSLSSIGLLGGYRPASRKKTRSSSSGISCMHIEAKHTNGLGFRFMQHLPRPRRLPSTGSLSTIENTSI
ncbi:hypothetical protein V6N13_143402 [Hibiscus sabdariffa]|uniref:Uncharacterized protein n=1 Tax=Hibiscus sabdariffa TaxID=183260 RepID=A0ABR2FHD7_9ROSI